MSILIQLDQKECQDKFRPGGKVRAIIGDTIIIGVLLDWVPGVSTFKIINLYSGFVRTIDYMRCDEVWYTPLTQKMTRIFKKSLKELETGKRVVSNIKPEDKAKIIELIAQITQLPTF